MQSSGQFTTIMVVVFGEEEMTTAHHIGLDVSVESLAICVIDPTGCVKEEFSVRSHPEDLSKALDPFSDKIALICLEAGPMSSFLCQDLKRIGVDSILMDSQRVNVALSAIL